MCGPLIDGQDSYSSSKAAASSSFYSEDDRYSEDDEETLSEDDEETITTADYQQQQRSSNRNNSNRDSSSNRDGSNRRGGRQQRQQEDSTVDTSSYFSQSDYESTHNERRNNNNNKSGAGGRRGTTDESSAYTETEDEESMLYAAAAASGGSSKQQQATSKKSASSSGVVTQVESASLQKTPLASSFAKRCYFTKAGIGSQTQHYEGLTLTGNVVLMLAAAMKLKGCPTICDEDLRRVEQTYPNQFSRLPDELLLSSGWRRISKYCHFSNKPVPDGIPFFHSKQRLHPAGGYYFLLAAAVGMVRPIDVEPLNRDTLVLLETDYPTQCDAAPRQLVTDPAQWTLVDKFCFFSGGPINTDEDVYYQADFDGNPIYMLAFLSPSLTPSELYKLDAGQVAEPGLKSVAAVEEVESVYDLTERDFDDLKLYHLGPCRALPHYILQPQAWTKVLPPHFLAARQTAMLRAQEFESRHMAPAAAAMMNGHYATMRNGGEPESDHQEQQHAAYYNAAPYGELQQQQQRATEMYGGGPTTYQHMPMVDANYQQQQQNLMVDANYHQQTTPMVDANYHQQQNPMVDANYHQQQNPMVDANYHHKQTTPMVDPDPIAHRDFQREVEEEGAFVDSTVPLDEAIALHAARTTTTPAGSLANAAAARMDPPEDEPPSLSKRVPTADSLSYQPTQSDVSTAENIGSYYNDGGEYYNSSSPERNYHETGQESAAAQRNYYETGPEVLPDDRNYYETGPEETARNYYETEAAERNYYETEGKYYGTSQEEETDMDGTLSPVSQGEFAPTDSSEYDDRDPSFGGIRQDDLPPKSPTSSEFSQSSAMRGAQEILRRNRERRLDMARRKDQEEGIIDSPEALASPRTDSESGGTWGSGSELTSNVSGSSVWTDNNTIPDRSSRRALILQMAKARMKSNKNGPHEGDEMAGSDPYEHDEEEKKLDSDSQRDIATEFDLTGDLD